ncbi:hypothetical protein [Nannocystis pusilla]|uniref:HD domain-containing protein n=1 Tax=Nannocystis pusilla TaxID=889268 RepID=A0ABS7TXS4_9BACT|nr:hypothetical protein [Nannocystis pusilla]MBZ5713013.1 hypothetical protein [Nannocystis pusilla]
MTGPDLIRMAAHHAEIDRDEVVLAAALCHDLRQVADSIQHARRRVSIEDLWLRVLDVVAASRAACGALSSVRVMTRGERSVVYDDSAPLPEALHVFRHRGNYRGAYASMAEIGNIVRSVLGLVCGLPPESRINITRALHLRGDLWTYVHEKVVHVFGRPGSAADRLLASEWPPRPAERPSLTLVALPPVDVADAPRRSEPDAPIPRPRSISLVQTEREVSP